LQKIGAPEARREPSQAANKFDWCSHPQHKSQMKQLIQPQAKAIRNAHQLSLASHFSAFHAVTAVFPLFRGSAIHSFKRKTEHEVNGE